MKFGVYARYAEQNTTSAWDIAVKPWKTCRNWSWLRSASLLRQRRKQRAADVEKTARKIETFAIHACVDAKSPYRANLIVYRLLRSPSQKFIHLLKFNNVDNFARLSLMRVTVLNGGILRRRKVLVFPRALRQKKVILGWPRFPNWRV